MIGLNLLPEKIRSGERLMLILLLGGGVYLLGTLVLGWRWVAARARVTEVQEQINAIQAQLDAPELREAVQAVERFTKDEKEKNDKASVVDALRKRQVTLIRLMDVLPDWMLNGEVWINKLSVTPDKSNRQVKLDGNATSALVFAHFFTNLDSQPVVSDLKLISPAGKQTVRGKDVVAFSVSFTLEEYK